MSDLLIVEDDDEIAMLVEMLLDADGHRVRVARNGEQGLREVEERLPDLVIMDVEMPLVDGPEMAARMRIANFGRERVPIVIMSGSEGLATTAARVGTAYYLAKPFSRQAIHDLVEQALREKRAPQPVF